MFFKKLILSLRIIPLLLAILLGSGCSLLSASTFSNYSTEQSTNVSIKEREKQARNLLVKAEKLIANATNTKDLQLAEVNLNQAKAHLEYLPTSYTTVSVELESRPSRRRSRRSRRNSSYYYDVDTETVEEDIYADLRAKAERLESQLAEKSEWVLQNWEYIQTAKQFAFAAAKSSQKPPHPVQVWEAIAENWQNAIAELKNISQGEPGYAEAQKLLKTYVNNLKIIQTRIQIEANASAKLDDIFDRVEAFSESTPTDRQTYILELQSIIKELKSIQPGTTAYPDAQKLLKSAQQRLKS